MKGWNKEKFENIFEEKERVEKEISKLNEIIIDRGMRMEENEVKNTQGKALRTAGNRGMLLETKVKRNMAK